MKKILLTILILNSLNLNCADDNRDDANNFGNRFAATFAGLGILSFGASIAYHIYSKNCNPGPYCNDATANRDATAIIGGMLTGIGGIILLIKECLKRRNRILLENQIAQNDQPDSNA